MKVAGESLRGLPGQRDHVRRTIEASLTPPPIQLKFSYFIAYCAVVFCRALPESAFALVEGCSFCSISCEALCAPQALRLCVSEPYFANPVTEKILHDMPPSGVSSLKRQRHAQYSGVPRFVTPNKASAIASPIDNEPSEGIVVSDDEPSEGLIVSDDENKTSNGVIVNDDENDEVDFTRTDDVSPIRIVRTIEPASATGYRVTRSPVLSSPSGIEDSELYGGDFDSDTGFDETQQLIPSDFGEGCSDASFVAPLISDDGGAIECGGEDTVTLAGRIDEESVNGSSGAAYDDSAFLTGAIGSDDLTKDDGMGGMSEWANDGAAGAVVVVATGAMKEIPDATTSDEVPTPGAPSEPRVPKTDPVTAAGWIDAADEQFRGEQVTTDTDWMDRLEVLVPDKIIEDLHKLASHLPRERAWVIQYLITSRKATALAVNHLKSLRAGTSNTSEQQTDAISSVTAEQQATSEYLVLSRKATQLALRSLQDQNILDKDMQISEFFSKSMKSLNHDISASGVGSNEHLTASPRTPERIISKGGAKARTTAPASLLKLKQGCTVVNHATKRMTSGMSRSALVAGSITARASAQSGRICKKSLKRCIKTLAITCATSVRGQRIMAIALLRLTKQAASFAGFASVIIMKGLLKLTVHTATAIAYILRIAIVDAPPSIREFMHDVIEEAHALEEARRH